MGVTLTVNSILAFCGGVVTISAAVTVLVNAITKAKEPNRLQDARIDALESAVEEIKAFLTNDKKRIDSIEDGNRVTQQALLALMSHAINGNDISKLIDARNALEDYLINR